MPPRESLLRLSLLSLLLFASASSLPIECQSSVEAGDCQQSLYRYYYDAVSGDCQRFIYTGCGGNANRFIRRSTCREKCLEGRTPPGQEKKWTESLVPMAAPTLPPLPSANHAPFPAVSDDTPKTPTPQCPSCDPLFGVCLPGGICGCKKGYKKAGRICVDLDECELSGLCPDSATCINTLGSFHCNCGPDVKCDPKLDPYVHLTPPPPPSTNPPFIYTPPSRPLPSTQQPGIDESACAEPFDMGINENCGVMLPRFYYESFSTECRAVLYGGCKVTSRNLFVNRKDCESMCMKKGVRATSLPPSSMDANSILSHHPSTVSSPPSTPPASTTNFPPLPWESLATTTSSDPFGLLNRPTDRPQSSPIHQRPLPVREDPPPPPPRSPSDHSRVDSPRPSLAPPLDLPQPPPSQKADRVQSPPSPPPPKDSPSPSSPSTCLLPFDETLRAECLTSTWTERFYYDSIAHSCVAFWYDSSCAAKDREGKNEFGTEGECERCKTVFDPKKDLIDVVPPLSVSFKERSHFTTYPPVHEAERQSEEEEEAEEEGERVEYEHSTSTSTSTPIPMKKDGELDEEEEKRKTEEAYLAIKNSDSCSGVLDSRLEEECDGDNWQTKYFYSSEKGSCRPFWYGGCHVDAHNFYPDEESCKSACGTHFPVEPDLFTQAVHHFDKKAEPTSPPSLPSTPSTPPSTTTLPEVISWSTKVAPLVIEMSGEESETRVDHSRKTFREESRLHIPSIEPYTVYPIEHSIKNRGSVSLSSTPDSPHPAEEDYDSVPPPPSIPAGVATDPCDDPIDPRLEEECDIWEYRAYFDAVNRKCVKFWFGRCEIKSRNLFIDVEACRAVCDHKLREGVAVMSTVSPPITSTTVPSTTSIIPTTAPMRECLAEHKEDAASRECGKEGRNWTQRYYFDHSTRTCRMYWGCVGSSAPNNFPDLLTCQWKCEPQRALPNVKSCLDPLDATLEDDCSEGNFLVKFHFDFDSKKCVSFHYGGCRSASTNVFDGVNECKTTCERPHFEVAKSCLEPFDRGFLNTCNENSRFEPKYYFDGATSKCEMFWWGGCRRGAANFFPSLSTCQWSCERPKKAEGPKQCADKFDEKLTEACQDGQWRERFYFNHESASCVPFWWDGCHSESSNFFRDLPSCQSTCEKNTDVDVGSVASTLKEEFRCLEGKKVGECRESYPAYYYDRLHRECRPFSYSGCEGNGNRFLTLAQCDTLCKPFTFLSEAESACYLPLDTGDSEGEHDCGKNAAVSYHFDRSSSSCAQFWFRGCGGNGNRFSSLETCNRVCVSRRRQGPPPIRKTRSTHGNSTLAPST